MLGFELLIAVLVLFPGRVSYGKGGVEWEFWWLRELKAWNLTKSSAGGNIPKKEEVVSSNDHVKVKRFVPEES